jgi:hypothetical protein
MEGLSAERRHVSFSLEVLRKNYHNEYHLENNEDFEGCENGMLEELAYVQ